MVNQSRSCEICQRAITTNIAIDAHHIIPRSRGGTAGPIGDFCRECHNSIHQDGWVIAERSPTHLLVLKGDEVIVEIYYNPDFEQGEYLFLIQQMEGFLEQATARAKWLDNDGLVAAAEATSNMGRGIWIYQAELLYWAMRRIPRGTRVQKLQAIAAKMGLGQSYAYDLLRIRESFPDIVYDERKFAPGFYRVASQADDPPAVLDVAEERLAEDPRYTIKKLKQELAGEPTCSWNHHGECAFVPYERCLECPDRTIR